MIAYCGLSCEGCPIHLATLEQDISRQLEMRISITRLLAESYCMNLGPEDINDCDGCRADTGRLFSGCLNCEIRKCAGQRNLDSCAFCGEYICDKLKEMFRHEPGAQIRLEELRTINKISD
jgi:hypothetical protein